MKMSSLTALSITWAIAGAPAFAQQAQDHASHHAAATTSTAAMADGEVRRIDKEAKKITLRHGEIRNLDMPPMTMVFQVKDPALLDKVRTGDKVKFQAEKVGAAYTVTAIEPVK